MRAGCSQGTQQDLPSTARTHLASAVTPAQTMLTCATSPALVRLQGGVQGGACEGRPSKREEGSLCAARHCPALPRPFVPPRRLTCGGHRTARAAPLPPGRAPPRAGAGRPCPPAAGTPARRRHRRAPAAAQSRGTGVGAGGMGCAGGGSRLLLHAGPLLHVAQKERAGEDPRGPLPHTRSSTSSRPCCTASASGVSPPASGCEAPPCLARTAPASRSRSPTSSVGAPCCSATQSGGLQGRDGSGRKHGDQVVLWR